MNTKVHQTVAQLLCKLQPAYSAALSRTVSHSDSQTILHSVTQDSSQINSLSNSKISGKFGLLRKRVRLLAAPLMFMAMFLQSCAQDESNSPTYYKSCLLPDDQTGTVSGRWKTLSIPVAFKEGDFSTEEMTEILTAADSWNKFYSSVHGFELLDFGGDITKPPTTTTAKPSAICSQGLISSGKFTGEVVIYKQTTWPYSNHDAIALTSYCTSPSSPVSNMYMAIMEVNYQDFFVEGTKSPDMQSLLLHEFGHLVGLNHSCDTTGKDGFPDCSDTALPEDYANAVMYPVVLFDDAGTGEKRRSLRTNDMARSNCLYDDFTSE